jgi:hypothetical protein
LKLNLQSRTEAATRGHRTLQKMQKYTEAVDRKKLADQAIRKRIANNQVSNLDVHRVSNLSKLKYLTPHLVVLWR